ncbi:methionine ABC transporter permease [Murdochiella massiliensis]|uniref:methionine ABC transporter permease n=1 Tax=Murdochiella massiliensis TaxID=1673723 RepID=UPI00082E11F1|nr:methionine ABC transporter permease [Murdochiella massiliensis]MBY0584097.1 ABC transporter permease [Murdochiella sp. Marseille-P8839]
MTEILTQATLETLYMVFFGAAFAFILGTPIGILLYLTQKGGLSEKPALYRVVDAIVNIARSIPYVILMILLIPVTRAIIGTAIGSTATIFSLAASAAPFFARLVETALNEVDGGILEAAKAMGSTNRQIIFQVLLPEALPSLIQAMTTTIINLIGYTAMAGALGGGGLGAVAQRYGYYRRQEDLLWASVIVIVVVVQLIQLAGNTLARSIDKR